MSASNQLSVKKNENRQAMELNLPGFPSESTLAQIEADAISGMQTYNLHRDKWAMEVGFNYFPDGDQRQNFQRTFMYRNSIIAREMEVYDKSVRSSSLFYDFRRDTISYLSEKKNLTPEEQKVKDILTKKNGRAYEVSSFYDFAVQMGAISPLPKQEKMHNLYDEEAAAKIDELNETRMETALAMYYYLDRIGRDRDDDLKFLGYGTFNKHVSGLVDKKKPENVKAFMDDLSGEAVAYTYLMHLVTHHPRWADICSYQAGISEAGSREQFAWKDRTPPVFSHLPERLTGSLGEHQETIDVCYNKMQSFEAAVNAIKAYPDAVNSTIKAAAFKIKAVIAFRMQAPELLPEEDLEYARQLQKDYISLSKANGTRFRVHEEIYPIPYFDLQDKRLNDSSYREETAYRSIESACMQPITSGKKYFSKVDMAHQVSGIGISWTPSELASVYAVKQGMKVMRVAKGAFAVKGATAGTAVAGPVGTVVGIGVGFAVGYVVDEFIIDAIEPVFNYIKSTRFDNAYEMCCQINERSVDEQETLKERLNALQTDIARLPLEKRQEIEQELTQIRSDLESALKKSLSSGYSSLDDKQTRLLNDSEYGPRLKAEMEKMVENYSEQEMLRLSFSMYSTALREQEIQQIDRGYGAFFNEMVENGKRKSAQSLPIEERKGYQERMFLLSDENFPPYNRKKSSFDHVSYSSYFKHSGYYPSCGITQKRLIGQNSAKVDEGLTIYPLFGESSFDRFKASELAVLKAKDPQTLSEDEEIYLLLLNNPKIKTFHEYFDEYKKERQKDKKRSSGKSSVPVFRSSHMYRPGEFEVVGFEESIYMYAQGQSPLGLRPGFKLFPSRLDVIRQARDLGLSSKQVTAQFLAERDVCARLMRHLSQAPDFEIVCRQNGWITDGKPDLSLINKKPAPQETPKPSPAQRGSVRILQKKKNVQPIRDQFITPVDVMDAADQEQRRLETLLMAFERHRSLASHILKCQQGKEDVSQIIEEYFKPDQAWVAARKMVEFFSNEELPNKEASFLDRLDYLILREDDPRKKQQYQLLIKDAATIDLGNAVSSGDIDGAKWAISRGADVNANVVISTGDGDLTISILENAVYSGDKEFVELLVSEGAKISSKVVENLNAFLTSEELTPEEKSKHQEVLDYLNEVQNQGRTGSPNLSATLHQSASLVVEDRPVQVKEREYS